MVSMIGCQNSSEVIETRGGTNADDIEDTDKGTKYPYPWLNQTFAYDWQNAYAEYFNDRALICTDSLYTDYNNSWHIGDMNGDNIPEIIESRDHNDHPWVNILTYGNGDIRSLEFTVRSTWGFIGYIEETRQFIALEFSGHTTGTHGNITNYALYDWTPDGYKQTYFIDRESGYYNPDTREEIYGNAYMNGNPVTNEEFELAKAQMDALKEKAIWFPGQTFENNADLWNYVNKSLFYSTITYES